MPNIPDHHRRNIKAGYVRRDGVLPPLPTIDRETINRAVAALQANGTNKPVIINVGGWSFEVTRVPKAREPITGINIEPGVWIGTGE